MITDINPFLGLQAEIKALYLFISISCIFVNEQDAEKKEKEKKMILITLIPITAAPPLLHQTRKIRVVRYQWNKSRGFTCLLDLF